MDVSSQADLKLDTLQLIAISISFYLCLSLSLCFTDICRCLFESMDQARTAFGTDQDIILIYEQKPDQQVEPVKQAVKRQCTAKCSKK